MDENKRNWVIIIVALTLFIALLIFVYVVPGAAVQASSLEECNSLGNYNEGGINIVFFSSQSEAKRYSEHFFNTYPFSENKNSFNFFYIDTYEPECTIYRNVALFCHSRELVKKSASCNADFIVVLDRMESKIRSSAYLNVMSINSVHPESVFIHEFGHVFANFAEEYNAGINPPRASPNCADSCSKFENPDGCHKECSNSEHYRSIQAGVMRTLSTSELGRYNSAIVQQIIKEKTSQNQNTLTGNVVSEENSCIEQSYLLVEFISPSEREFEIKGTTLQRGCAPEVTGANKDLIYRTSQNSASFDGEFTPVIWTESQDLSTQENIQGETYLNYEGASYIAIPDITADSVEIVDAETGEVLAQSEVKVNRPCKI